MKWHIGTYSSNFRYIHSFLIRVLTDELSSVTMVAQSNIHSMQSPGCLCTWGHVKITFITFMSHIYFIIKSTLRPKKIDSLSQHLLSKTPCAMSFIFLFFYFFYKNELCPMRYYIYIFLILFSVKLTLMPHTPRTYFDQTIIARRKGNKNEINFL